MKLDYELSNIQKEISKKLVDCYLHKSQVLVWAVCGSGKTEVVLDLIDFCLHSNLKVGFAIPRVEIVKEIRARLEDIFEIKISCLYGGSVEEFNSDLVCLTTHQLLKFYDYFDVLIIDEIDAFPFKGNVELENQVEVALKNGGLQVLLSATPCREDLKKVDEVFLMPNRYHGFLLDVPKFILCDYYKFIYKNMLPKRILKHFKSIEKQVLVFVPTIIHLKKVSYILNKYGIVHECISSKTLDKKVLLDGFRNKEISILLSTSVLERGVTFEDIDVIVLDAAHDIFFESTLVQICGRVGRKISAPTGNIYFYSECISWNMKLCKKNIKKMNVLAKKLKNGII